jgi:hypothetical protein
MAEKPAEPDEQEADRIRTRVRLLAYAQSKRRSAK